MITTVIKDYFQAFRSTNWEEGVLPCSFVIFPVYTVATTIFWQGKFADFSLVALISMLLLFVFTGYSAMRHPIRLSKLMYLSPMSREERLIYLKLSYIAKIVIPEIVALVVGCMLCLLDGFSLFRLFCLLLVILFLSVSFGRNPARNTTGRKVVRKTTLYLGLDYYEPIVQMVSLIIGDFIIFTVSQTAPFSVTEGAWILAVILLLEPILCSKIYKYAKQAIEEAADYETLYVTN